VSELETRIISLEKDVSQISDFFHKLDGTMDKLTEISSSIKEMLAVHELKISQQEDATDKIFNKLDQNRKDAEQKIEKVSDELTQAKTDFYKALEKVEKQVAKCISNDDKIKLTFMGVGFILAVLLWKTGVIPFVAHIPI
jgi:predicted  nucleic acid-binding Zn-ribbon protein